MENLPFRATAKNSTIALALFSFAIFGARPSYAKRLQPGSTQIQVVDSSALATASDEASTELRELLARIGIKAFAKSDNPQIQAAVPMLAQFAKTLLEPKDEGRPIHLVVADDMRVNAGFSKLASGDRVLIINLGLLHFVQNDDELAFVIGHELSHGTSTLQDYISQSNGSSPKDSLYLLGLQRAVENEVDVQSLVFYLQKKGFNANAARNFLDRLQAFGDALSVSHTSARSRRDVLDIALTALKRVFGQKVKPDHPEAYQSKVIHEVSQYLHSSSFRQGRLSEVKADLDDVRFPEEPFLTLRSLADSGARISDLDVPTYNTEYWRNLGQLRRVLGRLVSKEDSIRLEIELHRVLSARLEEARQRVYARGLGPRNASELVAYSKIRAENFLPSAPDPARDPGLSLGQAIRKRDEALAELETDPVKRVERQSEVTRLDREIEVLRENKRLFDLFFTEPEDYSGRRANRDLRAISLAHATRVDQEVERNSDLVVEGFADPHSWNAATELFSRLPAEKQAELRPSARKAYLRALRANLLGPDQSNRSIPTRLERLKAIRDTSREGFEALFGQGSAPPIDPEFEKMTSELRDEVLARAEYLDDANGRGSLNAFDELLVNPSPENWDPAQSLPKLKAWVRSSKTPNEWADSLQGATEFCQRNQLKLGLTAHEYRDQLSRVTQDLDWKKEGFDHPELLNERQKLSLILARHPELYSAGHSFLEGELGHGLRTIVQDLQTIVTSPGLREHLIEAIPLEGLNFRTARPGRVYYTWPEGLNGKELDRMSPLYQLVSANPEAFSYRGSNQSYSGVLLDRSYVRWLDANRPTDVAARVAYFGSWGKFDSSLGREFFQKRLQHWIEHFSSLPWEERVIQAVSEMSREFPIEHETHFFYPLNEGLETFLPSGLREMASFRMGQFLAAKRVSEAWEIPFPGGRDGAETFKLDHFWTLLRNPEIHATLSIHERIRLLNAYREVAGVSTKVDEVFEPIWKDTASQPNLRRELSTPEWVRALNYDFNRKEVSLWQIEDRFHLTDEKTKLRVEGPGGTTVPRRNQIRPIVRELKSLIDSQFPGKSAAKNEVIEQVESSLLTNQYESKLFEGSRLTASSWVQSRKLAFLDAVDHLERRMRLNGSQKLALVRYFIGVDPDVPEFAYGDYAPEYRPGTKRLFQQGRREFAESNIAARTYLLQPFLDAKTGILAEAPLALELRNLILGSHGHDPVIRSLFDAYADSLAESEKKVVFGHVLGSFANGNKGGASLKEVLEAMGPFGIKVGQFLATSGYGGPEVQTQLEEFLNRAMPPQRPDLMKKLREIFGPRLRGVRFVGELLGSGSVNYALKADIVDPLTKETTRVMVRIQREGVEGLVGHENEIWKSALAKLRGPDASEETKRVADWIERARSQTMITLKAGGAELDQRVEVANSQKAQDAYRSDPDRVTGLGIDVAMPLTRLQRLIPPELASFVSIYEYVDAKPIESLPPAQQTEISRQILKAELQAIFWKGVFDPDSHPGNWLYEPSKKRLVRVDYAQLRELSPKEMSGLRAWLQAVMSPVLDSTALKDYANGAKGLFEVTGIGEGRLDTEISRALEQALRDPGLPPPSRPGERVFFVRDSIEAYLHQNNPGAKVELSETAQTVASSLVKMKPFRDQLDDREFHRVFLEAIHENPFLFGLKSAARLVRHDPKAAYSKFRSTMECLMKSFQKR